MPCNILCHSLAFIRLAADNFLVMTAKARKGTLQLRVFNAKQGELQRASTNFELFDRSKVFSCFHVLLAVYYSRIIFSCFLLNLYK
jgi:hypothetical protein